MSTSLISAKSKYTIAAAAMVIAGAAFELHVAAAAPNTYATFFVLQGASSGNPMIDDQVRGEIKMALADKERVETSPELAEAAVVVHVATPEKHRRVSSVEHKRPVGADS